MPWANVRMDARSEDDKQRVNLVFVSLLFAHIKILVSLFSIELGVLDACFKTNRN